MNDINRFIEVIRRKLNAHIFYRECLYAFCAALLSSVPVAAYFIVQGLKVDRKFLLGPLCFGLLIFIIRYLFLRYNFRRTVLFADKFYHLHEGIVSAIELKNQKLPKGFSELQVEDTTKKCAEKSIQDIQFSFPRKSAVLILICAVISFWLCTLEDAPAIVKKREDEQKNRKKTEDINKALEEELKELEEELSAEEKEMLKRSELQKEIKNLQTMKDKKDALRQYAALEKKLRKLTTQHQFKEDEKLLQKIAEALKKARESREMGKLLSEKKYKDAAEMLKKMKQNSKEALLQRQKNLEKLRKMAQQMKLGANKLPMSKSNLKNDINKMNKSINSLSKQMKQALKEMKQKGKPSKQCSGKMGKASKQMNKSLDKFSGKLMKHNAKSKFMKKLAKLKQALNQCQKFMASNSMKMKANSRGIGRGTDFNRNKKPLAKTDKGYHTRLTGQKGEGESDMSVEDTAIGSGVSQLKGKRSKSNFKYQMESFVNREDVPESMKKGVKKYFKTIHNN